MEMENYLYNFRMRDKYTRKPSTLELARAFPDCRDIARRIMDELMESTKWWKDIIRKEPLAIHFMAHDPDVKRINELQKFLNLTSPILNNRIDTSKAKAYPIEQLYDFQKARRSSNRIQCSCPFHKDDSPSFVIYLESNTAHCFSCGFNGDSISIAMKLFNENFINAVRRLSK